MRLCAINRCVIYSIFKILSWILLCCCLTFCLTTLRSLIRRSLSSILFSCCRRRLLCCRRLLGSRSICRLLLRSCGRILRCLRYWRLGWRRDGRRRLRWRLLDYFSDSDFKWERRLEISIRECSFNEIQACACWNLRRNSVNLAGKGDEAGKRRVSHDDSLALKVIECWDEIVELFVFLDFLIFGPTECKLGSCIWDLNSDCIGCAQEAIR